MGSLNNLAITATNSAMISTIGGAYDTLQSLIANGGRDSNCKFYYNNGPGGSILRAVAKTVSGGAVSELKNMADNAFNSLMNGKRKKGIQGRAWIDSELKKQEIEAKQYGKMEVDGGVIYALDDWGGIATEALMLAVELDHQITITQKFPQYNTEEVKTQNNLWNKDLTFFSGNKSVSYKESAPTEITNTVNTNSLVWYDTTALVQLNSSRNVIISKIQGRDYSRKELASNGDIHFTISGQITSGRPDLYPSEEMQKFYKVMQYKGIVKVNNQVINDLGITHLLITEFKVDPKQGYKSLQNYSFQAIGLQPENEIDITEDTVEIISQTNVDTSEEDKSEWLKMLEGQFDGLKSMASDIFSQGTALATGLLDKVL